MFVNHATIQRAEKVSTIGIYQPINTTPIVFQQIPTI